MQFNGFTISLYLESVAPGLQTRLPWQYSPLVKICLDNHHSEHLLLALSIHIKSTEHWGTLLQWIWPLFTILILNNRNLNNHLNYKYKRWLLKSQNEFKGQATLSANMAVINSTCNVKSLMLYFSTADRLRKEPSLLSCWYEHARGKLFA